MKTIVVASHNPVKMNAALRAFQRLFPDEDFQVRGVLVPSEVSPQPVSDSETLLGAQNRARNAAQAAPEADFWVGIEGGISTSLEGTSGSEMSAYAWVVVRSRDRQGKSRTGTFFLPPEVASLVRAGKELGEADDIVFGRSNSKQDEGAIGILTGGVIDRTLLYEHAVVLALVPFKNTHLYPPGASPGQ